MLLKVSDGLYSALKEIFMPCGFRKHCGSGGRKNLRLKIGKSAAKCHPPIIYLMKF